MATRKGEAADAIKFWLRSQHAKEWSDFIVIGPQFHRWVRGNKGAVRLQSLVAMGDFMKRDFIFCSQYFLLLRNVVENFCNRVHFAHPGKEVGEFANALAQKLHNAERGGETADRL